MVPIEWTTYKESCFSTKSQGACSSFLNLKCPIQHYFLSFLKTREKYSKFPVFRIFQIIILYYTDAYKIMARWFKLDEGKPGGIRI